MVLQCRLLLLFAFIMVSLSPRLAADAEKDAIYSICEVCGCNQCPLGFRVGDPTAMFVVPDEFLQFAANATYVRCNLLENIGLVGRVPPDLCTDGFRLNPNLRETCACPPLPSYVGSDPTTTIGVPLTFAPSDIRTVPPSKVIPTGPPVSIPVSSSIAPSIYPYSAGNGGMQQLVNSTASAPQGSSSETSSNPSSTSSNRVDEMNRPPANPSSFPASVPGQDSNEDNIVNDDDDDDGTSSWNEQGKGANPSQQRGKGVPSQHPHNASPSKQHGKAESAKYSSDQIVGGKSVHRGKGESSMLKDSGKGESSTRGKGSSQETLRSGSTDERKGKGVNDHEKATREKKDCMNEERRGKGNHNKGYVRCNNGRKRGKKIKTRTVKKKARVSQTRMMKLNRDSQ